MEIHTKYKLRILMMMVVVSALIVTAFKPCFVDGWATQGFWWAISAIDGHTTIYSSGYSGAQFRSPRIGMTMQQVRHILGPPLHESTSYSNHDNQLVLITLKRARTMAAIG